VIAVLLAAAGVASGCLDVTARIRVDPDLSPGGRNHEGADALELLGIANDGAVRGDVAPALAGTATSDAGADIGGITQPRRVRRGDRIVKSLDYGRGEEGQTGYLDLTLVDAEQCRAIPVSVAMDYADCRELELALSSLSDERICAVVTASANWSIGCGARS
jgi:hypothetical protein